MTHDVSGQQIQTRISGQLSIAAACDEIKQLLLEKNANYGDSALDPVRIFSKASPVEQLLVRIDDKISRIQRGAGLIGTDEDVINDLIGYLVLLKIATKPDKERIQLASKSDSVEAAQNGGLWDGTDIEDPYSFLHYAAMDR
jgi:hypothetical protein